MITDEQLKEWEEAYEQGDSKGINEACRDLLQAYREQQKLIEKQKKEIERSTLDSKRLDFIDNYGIDWDGIGGYIQAVGPLGGDDLRDCIDIAMKRVSKWSIQLK